MCHTDISAETRQRPEPFLPLEGSPRGGRPARDKRTFMNAIIRLPRTGAPRRALPEEHGSWNAVYSRFRRWQTKGSRKAVFLAPASAPDPEAVMIDGTCIHAHKHSAGARGGSTDKPRAAVAEVLPPGCMHGQTRSATLYHFSLQEVNVQISVLHGNCLKGFVIALSLPTRGMTASRWFNFLKQEAVPQLFLHAQIVRHLVGMIGILNKERHLAECFFSKIKEYRRVATRYEKLSQTFLSFVYLAASMIWIRWFANIP